MIAVDTNLMIYAHRQDSMWHERAAALLRGLAEGRDRWAIPWPCVHEFIAIVTHRNVFAPPTSLEKAMKQIEAWRESSSAVFLSESGSYWEVLRSVLSASKVIGPRVHDARIFALCRHHGVSEIWSADRDFARFTGIRVKNPLVL